MAVLTLLGGLALVAAPPLVGVPTNDGDFGRYVEPVVVADPTLLPFAPGVGDRSAQYLSTSANGTRGDRSGLVWGPAASPPTPFINPRGNRNATGVYTPTTANGTRGDRAGLVWGSPTVAPTPFINQRGNRSTEYRFNEPRGDRAPGPPVQQRVVQNFPFFTSLTLAPPPPPPPPAPVQLSFQLDPFDVIGEFSTLVLSSFAMTALGFVTYTGALTAAMSPFGTPGPRPVVEYLLNEAGSGLGTGTVLDDMASPLNLTINYDIGGLTYAQASWGRGLTWDATLGSAVAATSTLTGTKIKTAMDGQTKASLEIVVNAPQLGTILVGIGDTNNATFLFNSNDTWVLDCSGAQGPGGLLQIPLTIGRCVICFVFDSTQSTASNRLTAYVNGVAVTPLLNSAPSLNATFSIAGARKFFIGADGVVTAHDSDVWYAALYAGTALSAEQARVHAGVLLGNDDTLELNNLDALTGTVGGAAVTGTLDAACSPFAFAATGAQTFTGTVTAARVPFATQPGIGIAVVQNTEVGSDGAGQSATYNAGVNFTTGSTVFFIVNSWQEPDYTSVTINGVAATKDLSGSAGTDTAAIWRADNVPGTGNDVVTVSGVGTCDYTTGAIIEVSGLQASPLDQTGTASGTSTAPAVTAAGANAQADEFSITLWANSTNDNGYSVLPTGYTRAFQGRFAGEGGAGAYKVLSAVETTSVTWTALSSVAWRCLVATYKGTPGVNLIETFTGTLSAACSPFALTVSGAETFTGTCTAARVPFAISATGAETFTGTASMAASSFAFSAAGAETFTGSCNAATSPFAFAATGAEAFTGTCSTACSPFALDATGVVLTAITGTVSAACSPFTLTSTGAETFTGTASMTTSPFAVAATGSETFTGSCTAATSPFAFSATGIETFSGTMTAATSPFALTASGVVTINITGTLSAACSSFAIAATGAETFAGTCSMAEQAFACTITGTEIFTGTLVATTSPFAITATGAETFTGTMSSALLAFAMAAAATETFSGTVSAAARSFATSATGTETFSGAITTACSSFATSSSGAETFTGTCTVAISTFALTAAGTNLLAITGTLTASCSPFAISLLGTETFSGSVTAACQQFATSLTGAELFQGSCAVATSPFAFDATGIALLAITGTLSVACQPFAVDLVGAELFDGTVTIDLLPFSCAIRGGIDLVEPPPVYSRFGGASARITVTRQRRPSIMRATSTTKKKS